MAVRTELSRDVPTSDIDPFSREFLADPHPSHHELREAGPVVWLKRYSIWTVARYAEVHATLNDWQTFCSSRGVGMSDFAKDKPWRPPSRRAESVVRRVRDGRGTQGR